MKMLRKLSFLLCCLLAIAGVARAQAPALEPKLEPFRPLLDKTWKGAFKDSTPEKPIVDVMRWERALNGKAVRVLHSINDGAYGGETLFTWDEGKQSVTYHYYTTAGFRTEGRVSFRNGTWITREVVTGSSGGVTEVRGSGELLPDGALRVKTEHMKDGKWQPGREVTYREDTAARVLFR